MRTVISFILFFACSSTALFANKSVPMFKSGNWDGEAVYNDQGNFQFCMITGSYRSGIYVFFTVAPDGTWQMMFVRPEGFSGQVQQRLDLYIDGRFVFGAPAVPFDTGLLLTLPPTAELFQAMRVGHNLKVVTPGGSAAFNLTGTAAALAELLDCTTRLSRPAVAGLPPAAPARTYTQAPPQRAAAEPSKVPRDQVLTYAANVLAAADVRNYQFLPYEDTDAIGDVVWRTEDGGIGAISMMKNVPADVDVDTFVASIFQQESAGCKGDLASGKKAPSFVDGTEIRKSFAVCRAGANSSSFEYTFVRMPNGILIRFTTGRYGHGAAEADANAPVNQRSEQALLRVALPK